MSGQATISIKDKQWLAEVATTYDELTTGLSGRASLPEGQGMLFDLGYDQGYIEIDMFNMLFPLDIIFINSSLSVSGVLRDVQPQYEAWFEAGSQPGARFFLEVNAGEADGIDTNDAVTIEGDIPSSQVDAGSLLEFMLVLMLLFSSMQAMERALEPGKPEMLGGIKLPAGYEPVPGRKG